MLYKNKKWMIMGLAILVVLVIVGIIGYTQIKRSDEIVTRERYKDSAGIVYECSKPIDIKLAPLVEGRQEGLIRYGTPVNQTEADQVCTRTGDNEVID